MNTRRSLHISVIAAFVLAAVPVRNVAAQVTPPGAYLGYEVGADYKLTTYETAVGYFELIAGESDRMIVRDMGPTEMGRRMKYAVISSAENLANLAHYRQISERMSLGRDLSWEEALELADEGRAIAWIDVGLHATECAPSEHAIQLAYDLVTDEDRMTRRIRENVITLLVFANPDGTSLVAEWYMEHLGSGFEYSMPWLYSKYIGHDNNRDSFNVTQEETRDISRAQNHEWFPVVAYNHHQTAPFPTRIWIPPYGEPTNPNKPALVIRWENLIGAAMGKAFDENDQPGAVSRISFDAWYPGYMTQIVVTHNIPSILTETALYRLATPYEYSREEAGRGGYAGFDKSAFYPSPWEGGWWRISDAVDYCLTASKAVLDVCSRYSSDMLLSKYKLAVDNIETFMVQPPFGWIVPLDQHDSGTASRMLDKLMLLGVEVYRAEEAFTNAGTEYPAGTRVIPMSQPFAMFVKTMMELQDYPDLREHTHLWQGIPQRVNVTDKSPLRPYDVAGWTLPLQMGVDYQELDAPPTFEMTRFEEVPLPGVMVLGRRGDYLFSASENNSFTAANRILEAGGRVSRALEEFTIEGTRWPAGTFFASRIEAADIRGIAAGTYVSMTRGTSSVPKADLAPLRLGHYAPWQGSTDEGWMRWIMDEYGFPYESLRNDMIIAGELESRFDVISIASIGGRTIINGNRPGRVPPEYAGGIGEEGLDNLREFVRSGGTLICNDGSCDFAIEQFDLPVTSLARALADSGFYSAGSVLKMRYNTAHPVAWGMQEEGVAFWSRARVFELDDGADGAAIVASFPDEDLLLSGYVEKDELIRGMPAVVEFSYGDGRVILFGFNFHNRAQSYSTFKLFFNALYRR